MKLLSRSEEIVLLAIWRLNDNAYGVTIRQQVSQVTGHEWAFGAVYVALDTLTRKGFVNKWIGEPTAARGGRRKCYYRMSQEGKYALKQIRNVHRAVWADVPDYAFD